MQQILTKENHLTQLQENVLIEFDKTVNNSFICKKLDIKQITLTKTLKALMDKEFIIDNTVSDKGKKMVHYLNFRNETISLFLKKYQIEESPEILSQLKKLDLQIIIILRNLL